MQQNDEANHVLVTIGEKLARLSPSSSECYINSKAYESDIVASEIPENSTAFIQICKQNDEANHGLAAISKKLSELSPSSSECFIFKVHNELREVNPKAYEPHIVAIGPYHRDKGKGDLKMMEEHKLRYLNFRLKKKNEDVEIYFNAMGKLEDQARKCYAGTLSLGPNEMIEMMLLDGFFIIELFRKCVEEELREENDPIFQMSWILTSLQRDLMLFENQLPFFVLCTLFDMIVEPDKHPGLIYLARSFFSDFFPGPQSESKDSDGVQLESINHLLGLVHDNWLPKPNIIENAKTNIDENATTENEIKLRYMQCATKLGEAGITFKKKDDPQSLFDIKFESTVMKIPTLRVEDGTESFFRNLIAYEQYGPHDSRNLIANEQHNSRFNFVSEYLEFMDCLINSSKDVTLLCRHEIIENLLGDDEVVATLFNKITDSVTFPNEYSHYAQIFKDVKAHCKKKRNRWMASLRRNQLSSPWAIISVLAAFVLLALTITQTVFSIIGK